MVALGLRGRQGVATAVEVCESLCSVETVMLEDMLTYVLMLMLVGCAVGLLKVILLAREASRMVSEVRDAFDGRAAISHSGDDVYIPRQTVRRPAIIQTLFSSLWSSSGSM